MLSKEEIYNLLKEKFRAQKDYWPTAHSDYLEIFYSAMDEYAKQEAIGFAEWICKEGWVYDGFGTYNLNGRREHQKTLYDLYCIKNSSNATK